MKKKLHFLIGVMLLSFYCVCQAQIVFSEDFGTSLSPSAANSYSRQTLPSYMPLASFSFATPFPGSQDSNLNMIDNNHYAVVAPPYIHAGSNPANNGYYFWTKPYNIVGNRNVDNKPYVTGHTTGTVNDAVLVVNAGSTLAPFYRRNLTLDPEGVYEVSMWNYIVQSPAAISVDIVKSTTGEVLASQSKEYFSPSDSWQNAKLYFTIPTICGADLTDLQVIFRSNLAAAFGNDYYIDDLSVRKISSVPIGQSSITITCPEVCTKPVNGVDFSWDFPNGTNPPNPVTTTFNQPSSTYGFTLDVYTLDNSFNMKINGQQLATKEIQFQGGQTLARNIRFKSDEKVWDNSLIGNIWTLTGSPGKPIIRLMISPIGAVSLYGSRTSGGPLEALELFNGNTLNPISWNNAAPNVIVVTQEVIRSTLMSGTGYGLIRVPCICTKPGDFSMGGIPTKMGISTQENKLQLWPEGIPNGFLTLESQEKGFVITRVSGEGVVTDPKEGMLIYDKTQKCVKLYNGSAWKCIKRNCNDL